MITALTKCLFEPLEVIACTFVTEAEILALEKVKSTLDENNLSKVKNRVKRVRNSVTNKELQAKFFCTRLI